jgi:asparagine synthase (glutamine-hydrolysing)
VEEFWDFADNLKSIPSMGDLFAMMHLYEQGFFNKGDIFINGQSGDYITGGHIFSSWIDMTETISSQSFIQAIIDKHYDLWKSFKTEENFAIIQDRISALIDPKWEKKDTPADRTAQLETWEYDGRQVCHVVHGQRIYEFLGFQWELPLWDKRLVEFCQTLTLTDKKDQFLYKSYLQDYNYAGLFPKKEPQLWRWPLPVLWVVPVARILGLLFGKKDQFYAFMRYFGHYADKFNAFPFKDHLRTYEDSRNVVSLSVRAWLIKNEEIIPQHILEKIR